MALKHEYVEIIFGRLLTIDELAKIAEFIDKNVTDDYFLTSTVREE